MTVEIETNNIRKITFGILNQYIDVTDMILKKLNNGDKIKITIDIFPHDPYIGKQKRLIIYYESGFNMIVNENDTIIKKIILKKPELVNIPQINNNMFDYIISTNARDEPNIIEWIIYHLMIGFNYVVIIDHKSTIPIQKLIDNYEWKNKVFVIRRNDTGAVKMLFLNQIIVPFMIKKCKKYFIHLDADEYLYIDKKYTLQTFTNMINTDIIAINWVMFGSNNMENNPHKYKCLIPTFTKSANTINPHFKLLIRITKNMNFIFDTPHTIKFIGRKILKYTNVLGKTMNGNNVTELMKNSLNCSHIDIPVYINHYFVQSKDDYIKRKINRERDDNFTKRKMDLSVLTQSNDIDNFNIYDYHKDIINKIEQINNSTIKINSFGFIMLRYVKCEETNKSWIRCYESIRKFYDNMIVIIDDKSNMDYVTNHHITNCIVISSEFPRRGELLPYYYYIHNKYFDRAVIIHDSMEFVKYFNFNNIPDYKNFTRLFRFGPVSYSIDIENFEEMSKYINESFKLYQYHLANKGILNGCFGVCYVIDHSYLVSINIKYNITNLINYIDTRKKRQCLERFLSCLFEYDKKNSFKTRKDIFGSIFGNKFDYVKKYFFGR